MAQLVVRNLDNAVKAKLQRRARRHGRSMEEEIREILRDATKGEGTQPRDLGSKIAACFRGIALRPGEEIAEFHETESRLADFEE